jgi:hypothetical protein
MTMFAQLLIGKPVERRKHKRLKDRPFRVMFRRTLEDLWIEGKSIDISPGGFGAFVQLPEAPVVDDSWMVMLGLDDAHSICVRVKIQSVVPGTLHGKRVYKLGCRFSGIAADDWHMLVRFLGKKPLDEAPSVAAAEAKAKAMSADDLGRIMPKAVLDQVLQQIIAKRRLAPFDGKEPLVKYYYVGRVKKGDAFIHNIRVVSRMVVDGENRDYNSRVTLAVSLDGNYRLDVS